MTSARVSLTLDGRDLAALQQYLPAVVDNVIDVYGKEVV